MIYVLFGQPESGKTTLGNELRKELRKIYGPNIDIFNIDGDQLREILPNNNYTYAGRYDNIKRANIIATYLNHQGCEVIVSLVNPYEELRVDLKNLNPKDTKFIYLVSDRRNKEQYFVRNFETPKKLDLLLNTSELSVKECLTRILDLI